MRRHCCTLLASLTVLASIIGACGGGTPSAPSLVSTPVTLPSTPTVPSPVTLNGRVTSTNGGQPLSEVVVAYASRTATTDGGGSFQLEWADGRPPAPGTLTISGQRIVTRAVPLSLTGSRAVTLDAISTVEGFDLEYYRQLVRNSLEGDGTLEPLRRWTRAPMVYLKTVDEAGEAIDATTLETVASALANDTGAFTGERFGIAGIQRGTGSQEGVSGWLTVKWPTGSTENICGRAQLARDGGWIELYYRRPTCGCGPSRIQPAIVKHELGHAFGFWHTDEPADIMFARAGRCDVTASAKERLHAAVAYSRPPGNRDPDADPGATSGGSLPVVVLP